MKRIAVLTKFDGTQQLKTLEEIFRIGEEYKQERRKIRALTQWCAWKHVDRIDIYHTDGKFENWLIECSGKTY